MSSKEMEESIISYLSQSETDDNPKNCKYLHEKLTCLIIKTSQNVTIFAKVFFLMKLDPKKHKDS